MVHLLHLAGELFSKGGLEASFSYSYTDSGLAGEVKPIPFPWRLANSVGKPASSARLFTCEEPANDLWAFRPSYSNFFVKHLWRTQKSSEVLLCYIPCVCTVCQPRTSQLLQEQLHKMTIDYYSNSDVHTNLMCFDACGKRWYYKPLF